MNLHQWTSEQNIKTDSCPLEDQTINNHIALASISHELRSPLNTIIAGASLLKDEALGALNNKQIRYVNLIEKQGYYLLDTINELLDFSKLSAGKLTLNIKNINLVRLINETVESIHPLFTQKNQTVLININPDIPAWMEGDADRLRQVFINLLSNAHKYSGNNTDIYIHCSSDINSHGEISLFIKIQDQGIGIQEQEHHRIFEPFEQLNIKNIEFKSRQGTGLGLSIVKSIVELHHGSISVASALNQGSTFTVMLPQLHTIDLSTEVRTPTDPSEFKPHSA